MRATLRFFNPILLPSPLGTSLQPAHLLGESKQRPLGLRDDLFDWQALILHDRILFSLKILIVEFLAPTLEPIVVLGPSHHLVVILIW
jgi:hypothetical protein